MLRTWNAENINQMGSPQRGLGGGPKARKALGDAGPGSENAAPASGKSGLLSDPKGFKQRRPLGFRSENAPRASGKGGVLASDSKPKQRRALGDISNAGLRSASGGSANGPTLGGKQPPSGLKFAVHSDSKREGSATRKSKGSATGVSKPRAAGRQSEKERERPVLKVEARVEDIEVAMGRTWEEEDRLVQQRDEERAAKKAINYFRPASRTPRTRKSSLTASSDSHIDVRSVLPDESPPPAGSNGSPPPAGSSTVEDMALQTAIDRMVLDGFEDMLGFVADGKELGARDASDDATDLDWMTMTDEDLNVTPLSPLDDSFLTQELEFNFV